MSCAEAFHCDAQTMLCVVLPSQGQPCADGFACAAGLGCADGVGTCEVLPGEGQPCASGQRFCADGLGCRESDQTCQFPAAAGLGDVCLLNPPDVLCADGLGCDFGANGSICRAKTGVGGVCNTDRTCEASTYCEFSTLTCTPRLADGAPCEDGNECLVSSTCAQTPQGPRCTPIPGRDEPCEDACVDDLACQGAGGLCTPALCVTP